jgi:hypothetical protein
MVMRLDSADPRGAEDRWAAGASRSSNPGVLLALLLVLCLASRTYFILEMPYCAEDAYITFRYALNWARGLGPVYNAGEKVWGFTSPLWTSYLSLTALAGAPVEQAARWTLVVCDLVTLWLGWRLLRRQSLLAAAGFGVFFALWPRLAQMPATGLESSLVTCLLLAAASLARSRWGGLLNGLLALSRPEGAAMSVLLASLLKGRQRVVWLAVAALQGIFVLYYGQLLPASVASKATVYGIQVLKGVYWLEWLIPGMAAQTHDGQALAPVSVLLVAGLVAITIQWRRAAPKESPLPVLLGCGLLTLFSYMVLGVPWFYWYAPTPMVAILLAAFLGLAGSGLLRWVLSPVVVFLLFSWFSVTPRVLRLQTHDAAIFASLGQTLRQDAAGRPASVILEPIGIIGYMSGMRVTDEVGLVTPWVAREREKGDGWYSRVMARDRPDYVVIRKDWLAGGVSWAGAGKPFVSRQEADSAMSNYEPIHWRAYQELPEGAARLLVLRLKR